ncbi:MAG TPA: tetratricopeptide repeat protein [Phycisphaerales bacterium]|nr:tetratricopeptide repeat protein [Phycisphaerales bacterium]
MTTTPPAATLRPASLLVAALGAGLALQGCSADRGWKEPAPLPAVDHRARLSEAQRLESAGYAAERAGRLDDAIENYRRAVQAYHDYGAAWHNLGVALMKRGDGVEAATAFRVAADLAPADPRPMFNLGVLYQQRQYLDEAARYYELALERDPGYQDALRYSTYLDVVRDQADQDTLDRLKRALLSEKDPTFREWMERQHLILRARLAESDASPLAH